MMEKPADYDIAVVGAGMIGSATAKNIKELSAGLKVALIGPSEATNQSEIRAAYYDEARMSRVLETDPVLAGINRNSVNKFEEIQQKSGTQFMIGKDDYVIGNDAIIQSHKDKAKTLGVDVDVYDNQELTKILPYTFRPGLGGIHTTHEVAVISARKLVLAQTAIAKQLGCDVIEEVVSDVIYANDDIISVKTEQGRTITTKKVILTPGAFADFRNILPKETKLKIQQYAFTAFMVEISPEDVSRFQGVGVVQYFHLPQHMRGEDVPPPAEGGSSDLDFWTLFPVCLYPDGKWYLKITHGGDGILPLNSPKEIDDWYKKKTKNVNIRKQQQEALQHILPDLCPASTHHDQCVISVTPTGLMYIDMLSPLVGLALGGCGYGAVSSEDFGHIAAQMIIKGSWDSSYPAERFKVQLE